MFLVKIFANVLNFGFTLIKIKCATFVWSGFNSVYDVTLLKNE